MANAFGGYDQQLMEEFRFQQGISCASTPKAQPTIVHVTDTTPHVVWTNELQYVVLELMVDGSLLIITRYNDVIKVPQHEYSMSNFDFRDYLLDDQTYHINICQPRPKSQRVQGSTVGLRFDDEQPPRDIIEEYHQKAYKLMYAKPPKQIIRKVPMDLQLHTSKPHRFTFWNFEQPTKEFYDCWYHSSNKWTPSYPDIFYCMFDKCNIHVINQDGTFPQGPVVIRPPIPH